MTGVSQPTDARGTSREAARAGDAVPTRVLVLGMAHEDGSIHGDELYPAAQACGFSDEQVRSCLRRLFAEGLLLRDGRGRRATFRSTPEGMSALKRTMTRTQLAYAQDAAGKGWDRNWRLVAFAIPESQRQARDDFRAILLELGGAAIQNGLYVSAHAWHEQVNETAKNLGLAEYLTLATTDELAVAGVNDPRLLARHLWPIDMLANRYEAFVERYKHVLDDLSAMRQRRMRIPDSTFLPGAFAMATALNECFQGDPLLPPELLPRPWPGRAARDLTIRSRRLAIASLESHRRPTLFRLFDEAVESLL